MDKLTLDKKISILFHGGERVTRQVRLTEAEAEYVNLHYMTEMRELAGNWYEITFTGGQH